MTTETPPGFKKYPMIVTPQGKLLMPASCSVIDVQVFDQREFEAAMKTDARLDDTLEAFGARPLASYLTEADHLRQQIETDAVCSGMLRDENDHHKAEVERLRTALEEVKLRAVQRDLHEIARAALADQQKPGDAA